MSTPNILFIDIETSPVIGYTWGMYEQNVLDVIEPMKIICAAWKWADQPKVHVAGLPDFKGYKPGVVDDLKLVSQLWKLLDAADLVIAQNGDQFDIKSMNARFVAHGFNAPSAYKTVDTRKVAKKYFRFGQNSLDGMGKFFDLGSKVNNGGFETWLKCIQGDKKTWALMKKYNAQDVILLEKIYLKLRPFIVNHPNLNILGGTAGDNCPSCLSEDLSKRGFAITKRGRYQRLQCNDCGAWSQGPYEKIKTNA